MARFDIAEAITGRNEGGYANDPDDRGGETFAGIARNFWGSWAGWKYIDRYKSDYAKAKAAGKTKLTLAQWVNASAKVITEPVQQLISDFYHDNFWKANKLDQLKDQQLANSVYDMGVNSGKGRAVQLLEGLFGIKKDGIMDPQVIAMANAANPKDLLTKYNAAREAYYRSIAKGNQAKWLKGWLLRLKPYDEMRMIQYRLGLAANGLYDAASREAIKVFQRQLGLVDDGIPGEKTLAEFYKI